jgi:hypothetical protein
MTKKRMKHQSTRVKCLYLRLNRLVWYGKRAWIRPMSPKHYFWEPQNGLQRQVMGGRSPKSPRKLNMTSSTITQLGDPGLNHAPPFALSNAHFKEEIESTKTALDTIWIGAGYLRYWDKSQTGDFFKLPKLVARNFSDAKVLSLN